MTALGSVFLGALAFAGWAVLLAILMIAVFHATGAARRWLRCRPWRRDWQDQACALTAPDDQPAATPLPGPYGARIEHLIGRAHTDYDQYRATQHLPGETDYRHKENAS